MFSRKKKAADLDDEELDQVTEDDEADDVEDFDEVEESDDEEGQIDQVEDDDRDDEDDQPSDQWVDFDESRDWREDGPFDISEVDLDADDVTRLDFGSLVVTPFDGMKLQLQVKQGSNQVQALLVVGKHSAIEVALFSAPLRSSMLAEVRGQMQEATDAAGGKMTLVEGPLGTEIRRKLPAKQSEANLAGVQTGQAFQPSRTWLAQGPRWLLRGVLMGQAAVANDVDAGEAQLLYEFFCNLVVRRGDAPKVPGELIPLDMPAAVAVEMNPA